MSGTDQSAPQGTAARATRGQRRRYAGARWRAYQAAWVAAATVAAAIVSLGSGGGVRARAMPATASRCSLNVIYGVAGESAGSSKRVTAWREHPASRHALRMFASERRP